MERVRAAAVVALPAVLLIASVVLAAVAPAVRQALAPIPAAVAWPPSTLVVSEIQTGGASASDEFAEISNVGSAPVDLGGLELVYVTSTGGTVTRKAAWSAARLLDPGRHLLVANTSGAYATVADATYSGGFAATGGTIVLRVVGGAPIDAAGWGDATNAFVEGAPAPAPAAGTSIERRPGGLAGNTMDTNDNLADFFAQGTPNPQNLSAPPVPVPGASPSPTVPPTSTATVAPTVPVTAEPSTLPSSQPSTEPTIEPTPSPSVTATPSPSAEPTPTPEPTSTPEPSPIPTSTPTATASPTPSPSPTATPSPTPGPTMTPSPSPLPTPTPQPTPSPTPAPVSIAAVRSLPDGTAATVVGTLTTDLGALEAGRAGFVQDASAGIAVYLDAALAEPLAAGSLVRLEGTVDTRYEARTLRVIASSILDLGPGVIPWPLDLDTGAVGEDVEGLRVRVTGITAGSPTTYADGLGVLVDDGTGPVRVIVGTDALGSSTLPAGTFLSVSGPVGQRDSSGTGAEGYRIHATLPGELELLPPPPTPTPAPTATPGATPVATPPPTTTPAPTIRPSAAPTASPLPTASPAPSAAPSAIPSTAPSPSAGPSPAPAITIAEARARTVGSAVTVIGIVTAEAGRIGTPSLLAIGDATSGILVRVPDGTPNPPRGTRLAVTGVLAAPYGQLEIRPAVTGFVLAGTGLASLPVGIVASDLGEGTEGRLTTITGVQQGTPSKSTSGDLAIDFLDVGGRPFRVLVDGSSGIVAADLRAGSTYRLTGIAGQRASRKDALDGYRVWLRDRGDIVTGPAGPSGATPSPSGGSSGEASIVIPIAAARRLDDAPATVEGVVTTSADLLDSSGRRIVVQDTTGAIEVLLPDDAAAPAAGTRVRVAGTVGRAWDAPRLRAASIDGLGIAGAVTPSPLSTSPSEADEWELVRIAGTITRVTRLGDRWRADVQVGRDLVLVSGLAGSGIPSTALAEGRAATIVGIVRRPYPSATDRRWSVVPRGSWDVALGPGGPGTSTASGSSSGSTGSGTGRSGPGGVGTAGTATAAGRYEAVPIVDLAALAEHVGELVRVGGLVDGDAPGGFILDDGTALARVQLSGATAEFQALIEAGDAIGVAGTVVAAEDGSASIVVTDPAGLVRLGALGESIPIAATGAAATVPTDPKRPTGRPMSAASLASPFGDLPGGWLGMGGVLGLSMVSLVVTALRRRRTRERLVSVVTARLAELRRPPGSARPPFGRA